MRLGAELRKHEAPKIKRTHLSEDELDARSGGADNAKFGDVQLHACARTRTRMRIIQWVVRQSHTMHGRKVKNRADVVGVRTWQLGDRGHVEQELGGAIHSDFHLQGHNDTGDESWLRQERKLENTQHSHARTPKDVLKLP
jgi:hypothetical protein